mgnify:FL=1
MENYDNYTDEQLVDIYHDGDEYAFEVIYSRYKSVIEYHANNFFLQGGNRDDLLQEGNIGLVKAVNAYKRGNASFKTFASTCIKNNILSEVSKDSKKANYPLNESVPLENIESENISGPDPLTHVIAEENSEEGIKRVRAVLSDFEIKVVEYVLKGYSKNAEIAELMNKDAKSIDNAKQRILNKLQNTEQNND